MEPKQVVYQIRNTCNNKIYIGSATNYPHRKRTHLSDLKNQKHHSNKLQNAWNKYGNDNFIFEILEIVTRKEDLIEREQYWLDTLEAVKKGYNINPTASNCAGRIVTEKTREKIREKLKGKPLSPEHIAKRSESRIRNKKPRSRETMNKIANAQRGIKRSEETKEKLRISHLGKSPSPEAIAKGIATKKRNKELRISQGEYSSLRTETKQSPEHIAARLAGRAAAKAQRLAEAAQQEPYL